MTTEQILSLLLLLLTVAPLLTRCIEDELEEELELKNLPRSIDKNAFEFDEESKKFLLKKEACYGDLGCFSTTGKFFSWTIRPVLLVPQSPEKIGVKFMLFTRLNPASPDELIYKNADSVRRTKFSKDRPTKLVIHGYMGKGHMSWMNRIRRAILKRVDCNVIQVGWSGGAATVYNQAASNTRVVGAVVARMLTWLETRFGVDQNTVHVIGFSLGAQVAGYAGERMRIFGKPISRITGLDPSGPYFDGTDPIVRLDPTDAQFVDVVHTDASHWHIGLPILSGGFGTREAVGHVDFFVNGGHHQPGCSSLSACDHRRAPKLFITSLEQPSQSAFAAFPCANYDKFRAGKCGANCPRGGCPAMGYYADKHRTRLSRGPLPHPHYLFTGPAAPFAVIHFHVSVLMAANSPSGRSGELRVQLSTGGRQCGPHELVEERELEPRSKQTGVIGCNWITVSRSGAPQLKIHWTDGSTFGSWFDYKITIDSVTLTEMAAGHVHRYCRLGTLSTETWVQGSLC